MLGHHAWTDLLFGVFELSQMGLRQGREVGDQSVCVQGCPGQSTDQREALGYVWC